MNKYVYSNQLNTKFKKKMQKSLQQEKLHSDWIVAYVFFPSVNPSVSYT